MTKAERQRREREQAAVRYWPICPEGHALRHRAHRGNRVDAWVCDTCAKTERSAAWVPAPQERTVLRCVLCFDTTDTLVARPHPWKGDGVSVFLCPSCAGAVDRALS